MWRNKILKHVTGVLVLMLVFVGLATAATPQRLTVALPQVQESTPLDGAQDVTTVSAGDMLPRAYLPLVLRDYGPRSSRLGYCALSPNISNYADVGKLAAGWYVRFEAKSDVPRPRGMDYVQVVRLHQETTCWPTRTRDRAECPYVRPYNYIITSPASAATREEGLAQLTAIADTNPGMLWFIGNEMDRRDWEGGGQDEMLPELYARAYYEIHNAIKAGDPTAQVGIGGMVQATPTRLQYLTKMWNAYVSNYGSPMPVDVWNVHNFIFKEDCNDYGADVPPGYSECTGTLYSDGDHNNMIIFKAQIRAFRQWMREHEQQQKPLVVSEYGIVYHHAGMDDLALVQSFLTDTFDYFMNTKDCDLGYPADECRLVQRWAWYSLDDNNPNFNPYAYLIDPTTGQLTATGQTFMEYAQRHLDVP
ncbi:MAG TPA: hypothetical protein PKL16_01190 [Anaerolineae bacterium]|nr:hypothetical protein [Anaerolineae bacterium]HQM12921.1 hypothetical protein [Anaerolineae bacterium]